MREILDDLAAEHDDLDSLLDRLPREAWSAPTPAAGWAVIDQVAHLHYFDRTATVAATDADAFAEHLQELMADPADYIDGAHAEVRALGPEKLLAAWRSGRRALVDALAKVDPSARLPWYGPSMGARSFATARLMETWAHGQDIADAVGADRAPTARLRHIAHIGVRARAFSFVNRGLEAPDGDVRVELDPPGGGEPWAWGSPESEDRVHGPAVDFCLVVTQRRHLDQTGLRTEGDLATRWMALAQAFAGPPTEVDPGRRGLGIA